MDEKAMSRFLTLFMLAAVGIFLLPGCADMRHVTTALSSSSKPYQEFMDDPVALTTIKTVAIFPFDDRAPQPGFDSGLFASKLANQLAAHGKVRVLYPQEMLETVMRENRASRRHNADLREKLALGLIPPEAAEAADRSGAGIFGDDTDPDRARRAYFNPVKNVDEAVRLARRAKADAIIVGEVSDFDPYMRPRLTLTMRLIATGNTESAAQAIAEMTQWGIPRAGSTGAPGGTVYVRQQAFDSTIGSVGMDVSKYGRSHFVDNHPYDTELFIRSMGHYYDVVASQLAGSYAEARKKAVKEAEERAKAEARRTQQDQAGVVARLMALMDRDSRIPDYETDSRGEDYFDQAFAEKEAVLAANGGDRRIQSWRPEGRASRPATAYERAGRDARVPENERGAGLDGYSAMADSSFPDADGVMEMNLGANRDNRDRSWRPDYYNRANPERAAPLYAPEEFRGR